MKDFERFYFKFDETFLKFQKTFSKRGNKRGINERL
jgi:hypothetical protein